ncbi:hypothetical protein ABBQ38_002216 [Trebouxia sp. C0009 RCD-2024]
MILNFRGSQHFRQRLVCSTLSGKSICIRDIRAKEQDPGVRDYEASLLRLLEKITNGCVVEINETGTTLRYSPGIVTGGSGYTHDCGRSRSIGFFLEPLVCIALFAKKPLSITLRGITNAAADPSVDVWRTVTLPLLRQATGLSEGFELKIIKRGAEPLGGGEVQLSCPVAKQLPPINMTQEGESLILGSSSSCLAAACGALPTFCKLAFISCSGAVRRIRGVSHSMRVSPQSSNRMVDGARSVLNDLLADVYIFTDHMTGPEAGQSPGYGLMLVAETTTGCLNSAECTANAALKGEAAMVPEEVGRKAAHMLLEEIHRGGVTDGTHQGLLLLLCALGPEEINEVRLGPLTPYSVRTLRHLKDFFAVTFSIKPEAESQTLFLKCIGTGHKNMSKRVT